MYYKYYKICVSGAADITSCPKCAIDLAKEVGREIVKQKGILITGATTGIPYWAALGANEENGFSVGLSPAASEKEHIKKYRLPTDYLNIIIYTGFSYSGRNLLLTRAADGVIIICGRMGTLNEFTIAFEDKKPIGILEGTGGAADEIRELIKKLPKKPSKIIFDKNPKMLVKKLIKIIKKEKERNKKK